MTRLKYIGGVATLELDAEACIGCGLCAVVCPHGVFRVEGGKASIVEADLCMECGACATNCPVSAVSIHPGVGCAMALLVERLRSMVGRSSEGQTSCCGEDDSSCC